MQSNSNNGDRVEGDKIGGDKVSGDKVTTKIVIENDSSSKKKNNVRILLISDFLYYGDNQEFLDNLFKNLSLQKEIDIIFFMGNLIKQPIDNFNLFFEHAKENLLNVLSQELGVTKELIFICCGDNDVKKTPSTMPVYTYLNDFINSNEALDVFVREGEENEYYALSVIPLMNYQKTVKEFHSKSKFVKNIDPLFSTYIIDINLNFDFGIVILNTAWLSYDSSKNNLLIPPSILNKALKDIDNAKFKILLINHPFSRLRQFNQDGIESTVYAKFDSVFMGYFDDSKHLANFTTNEGLLKIFSPNSLSLFNKKVGYSIIEIESADNLKFNSRIQQFNFIDNNFIAEDEKSIFIPNGNNKNKINQFRKKIQEVLSSELKRANELFLSGNYEEDNKNFLELFNEPVLKEKSKTELVELKKAQSPSPKINDKTIELKEITLDNLNNYQILGANKSGKSSLLRKIQLNLLMKISELGCLPLYIDLKLYYLNANRNLDIKSLLQHSFAIPQTMEQFKILYEKYNIKILLDNYDVKNKSVNAEILKFYENYPKTTFVFCSDKNVLENKDDDDNILRALKTKKVYIYDITRTQIRQLANKWPNIAKEKKDTALEKIFTICSQLNIPYNYWSVSLFLWIFEKSQDINFNNNFGIIDAYIEGLLERKKLNKTPFKSFSYENFKTYLSELAHYLLIKHEITTYAATMSDIEKFTEDYKRKNIRVIIKFEDIWSYIIERGVLYNKYDNLYTFRLNGVFEYFLAYYMSNNPVFTEQILDHNKLYLSFKNELELYSGLKSNDEIFLLNVYFNTQEAFEKMNVRFINIHDKLDKNLRLLTPIEDLTSSSKMKLLIDDAASKIEPLSKEEQDTIIDDLGISKNEVYSEVKKKREYKLDEVNSEILLDHIFILSRVYKNSDNIKDNNELMKEIFSFIIKSACKSLFFLFEESKLDMKSNKNDESDKLFKLSMSLLPLVSQVFLYDAVGHKTLETIINDRIEEILADNESIRKKEKDLNRKNEDQLELYVLYFLLIETDLDNNSHCIGSLIKNTSIKTIQLSILAKLYYLLSFKSYDKPILEKILRDNIQDLSKKMNPKADLAVLQKQLDNIHKLNIQKK